VVEDGLGAESRVLAAGRPREVAERLQPLVAGERVHEVPRLSPAHEASPWGGGASCCGLVYDAAMATAQKAVRQSVSLPNPVARRVRAIAKARRTSANRVLVDLIETGLEAGEAEKRRFFDLARRFKESSDPAESERLREDLARMIFGE